MMQISTWDSISKIYRAKMASRSLKFKFFHDYRLGKERLQIFDFTECVIHSTQHKKLIITRLNQYTKELEIHIAESSQIEDMLNSSELIESIKEVKIVQKEQMELPQFKKLVSVNIQNEKFLIIMTDCIIFYHMESLITNSAEKAYPIEQLLFNPIRISFQQYLSIYSKDKIYLFLKNASYNSEANEIVINYTLIDLKNKDTQQQNKKIRFGSRKVVQVTETMLTYIQKAKIEDDYIKLTVFTQYKGWGFKQKVFYSHDQIHVENQDVQVRDFDCDSIDRFSNNQQIKKTKAAIEIIVN